MHYLAVMFHLSVSGFGFVHLSNLSVFAVQIGSPDCQMKCPVQKLLFLKKNSLKITLFVHLGELINCIELLWFLDQL